jgi:hypothetical protein
MPEVLARTRLHDAPKRVYHTDLDCPHAPETARARALSRLAGEVRAWRECKICAGEAGGAHGRERHRCPKCGGTFRTLPSHMRACDGGES